MKALILGSTGAVGSEILGLLLKDPSCEKIYTIGRRLPGVTDPKLTTFVLDIERVDQLPEMDADTLLIAFGTTLRIAGSKERQEFIDVEIPTKIMKLALGAGIMKCALVSAVGVSESSPFFYSRMKARLDKNAQETGFSKLVIVKPSVLDGVREDKRLGERVSIVIGNFLGKTGLINAYRPVKTAHVAAAMIQKVKEADTGISEVSNAQIPIIAQDYFRSLKEH